MTLYRITKEKEKGQHVYKIWQRPKGYVGWIFSGDKCSSENGALKRLAELKYPFKEPEYEIIYEDKE